MLGPIDKLERQILELDRIRPAQRAAVRLHLKNAKTNARRSIASPNALGMWFVGGIITDHLKKDEAELKGADVDVEVGKADTSIDAVRKKDVTKTRLVTLTKLVLRSLLSHKLSSVVTTPDTVTVATPE